MPNVDGGHYFLTAFIPIRGDEVQDPRGAGWVTSHLHRVRETLASMPPALQTWATEGTGINSPFARDARTHFARLVVLDDVACNGRVRRDAIGTTLRAAIGGVIGRRLAGSDPLVPDPVDHLPHPYLIFVCDFDAPGGEADLDGYLHGLWGVMEREWRDILQHCHGYERVTGPAGFASLIRACQIETTMSFNDYYVPMPALPSMSVLPVVAPLAIAAIALVAGLLGGIVTGLFGGGGRFWWWLAVAGLVGLPLAVWFAYSRVVAQGMQGFAAGQRTDLTSVMKALHLQQAFTRFAIAQQGADAAALHAAFGDFLRTHRPDDPAAPTQARGTVRSLEA